MSPNPTPGSALTPREIQVLACLRDGMTLGETAARYGIRYETVRSALARARIRLGTSGKTQTVVRAIVVGSLPLIGDGLSVDGVNQQDPLWPLQRRMVVVSLRNGERVVGTLASVSTDRLVLTAGARRREVSRSLVTKVSVAQLRRMDRPAPRLSGPV